MISSVWDCGKGIVLLCLVHCLIGVGLVGLLLAVMVQIDVTLGHLRSTYALSCFYYMCGMLTQRKLNIMRQLFKEKLVLYQLHEEI